MRSLRKDVVCKNTEILGLTIRYGKWYKITIRNENKFWLARYYGVNDRGDFLHMGNTYVVGQLDYLRHYDCGGRDFYSLCDVNEITGIMKVDVEYVESIITF
jgi:hypothetical protein